MSCSESLSDLGHGVGVIRVPLRLRCCRRWGVVLVLESRGGVAVAAAAAAAEEPEPPGVGGLGGIFAVPAGETEKSECEM